MKLVVAMVQHETNTFSPIETPLSAFHEPFGHRDLLSGDDAIAAWGGTDTAFGGLLTCAREAGAVIAVPLCAIAEPSAPISSAVFDRLCEPICKAVEQGCDAVFLDLHGAMVVEGSISGEAMLLARLRTIAPGIPVAVALDFHANISAGLIENCSVVTGYRTYPHVDMFDAGARAGRLLLRALKDDAMPRILGHSLPMLTHMLRQTPAQQPMKDIMDIAIEAERAGAVLAASVFGGFPLADVAYAGLSTVIVADDKDATAGDLLSRLSAMAWERREDFVFQAEPIAQSIGFAATLEDGPTILVDHGDNSGAGGSMDDMTVANEVLRQNLTDVSIGPIWDPVALAAMRQAGIGADVTLTIGGRTTSPALGLRGQALDIAGTVRTVTDGRFRIEGPMMTGAEIDLGGSAVLKRGETEILVVGQRSEPCDLGYLTHAGIDPRRKRYVMIKSRQHFRAAFEKIAQHIVLVAGPGVCSSDYGLFDFRHVRRPIYPLNPGMSWHLPGDAV